MRMLPIQPVEISIAESVESGQGPHTHLHVTLVKRTKIHFSVNEFIHSEI